ncbi:Tyrosine decarboxylase [Trichinella spiralis]|uniref:Tyrosine decarboxylase n=1 Tax=Trichinella spiralis TaxID=6334 RepID=A0ABR3K476_TRISP
MLTSRHYEDYISHDVVIDILTLKSLSVTALSLIPGLATSLTYYANLTFCCFDIALIFLRYDQLLITFCKGFFVVRLSLVENEG